MRLTVLAAAYPSPTEPERALFLEHLHHALLEESGGELEMSVVAPRVHANDPLEEERKGVAVHRFSYPSGGLRLKQMEKPSWLRLAAYFLSAWSKTRRISHQTDADLILAHWVVPAGAIAASVSRWQGKPLVVYAHGSDISNYAVRGWGRRLARNALKRSRRIIAVSDDLVGKIGSSFGMDPGEIDRISMGVGPAFTSNEILHQDARPAGPLRLLFVGDLSPEKGIDDLLKALCVLRDRGLDVRLRLAGRPCGVDIDRYGSGLGEALQILGPLTQERVAEELRASDVYVHPSHGEGAPLAVMEALSLGVPVLATRVGGVPELIDDEATGLLVPSREPMLIAKSIARLIEDPDCLKKLRAELSSRSLDFSASARARELLPILKEAAR